VISAGGWLPGLLGKLAQDPELSEDVILASGVVLLVALRKLAERNADPIDFLCWIVIGAVCQFGVRTRKVRQRGKHAPMIVGSRRQSELGVDAAHVSLDGLRFDEEDLRDRTV